MKTNEYFKKHGLRKCKSAVQQNGWLNTPFWVQLKRLVQSHDLVFCWGTLEVAKTKVAKFEKIGLYTQAEQLRQAIVDVESCL